MKIKFTVHGEGYFIKLFSADSKLFHKLKNKTETEINNILFDSTEFQKLDLKDHNGIAVPTFFDLMPDHSYSMFCIDKLSRLEIKEENKRKHKLLFSEITRPDYLFPLFKYDTVTFAQQYGIMVLEHDIGNFGNAFIDDSHFDIQELRFELTSLPQIQNTIIWCTYYRNKPIEFKKQNTLNKSLLAFFDPV